MPSWQSLLAQTPTPAEVILDLHRQKFQWMVERDTARLAVLLDEEVAYVHSNGWHESRTDVLSHITSGRLRYHQIDVQEANVRQYGSTLIVNGRARFDVALDDQTWQLTLDYTEVYVHENGAIRLVSRHACRVPDP